jgi:hypothetical protein
LSTTTATSARSSIRRRRSPAQPRAWKTWPTSKPAATASLSASRLPGSNLPPLGTNGTNIIYQTLFSNAWYLINGTQAEQIVASGSPAIGTSTVVLVDLNMDASNYVLHASLSTGEIGLYRFDGGSLAPIVTTTNTLEGIPNPLYGFGDVNVDEWGVAFSANDSSLGASVNIYRYYEGTIKRIAGVGDPLPDTVEPAYTMGPVAFDGGNLAFLATTAGATSGGIYLSIDGELVPVVTPGTRIGSFTATDTLMDEHALSGNTLVFKAWDRSSGKWLIAKAEITFDDMEPVPADYDGDGRDDTAFYDEKSDVWFMRSKQRDFETHQYGYGYTIAAPADYDGDELADRAVFDPAYGNWYILASHDGFQVRQFGYNGVVPLPRDYDGDRLADLCVYDPQTGWWYVMGSASGFRAQQFGHAGTTPVPADFDYDGRADFAVYERGTGNWYILEAGGGFMTQQFGYRGVTPRPTDFDHSGADFVVFDGRNGMWYVLGQNNGFSARQFGFRGCLPVSADYDGDTWGDYGVYDPRSGTWYRLMSSEGFRIGGI